MASTKGVATLLTGEGSRPRPAAADCVRSPEPCLNKGENTPLASKTPSRRAGIQLRRTQPQMAVRPQATSDRQRALPVRVPRPLMGSFRTIALGAFWTKWDRNERLKFCSISD